MPSIIDFNGKTTVSELLGAASDVNAASVTVTGRGGDDRPLWSVIAVHGDDTWKYLLACQALEIDNEAAHHEVLDALRTVVEKYGA